MDTAILEQVLLRRLVPGDSVRLADETLRAALDGSRVLNAEQRKALQGSPMTLRRFRALSLERSAATRSSAQSGSVRADPLPRWQGSEGLLLAADSGTVTGPIHTSDGLWSLHFQRDLDDHLQVFLKLDPQAPFAAELVANDAASSRLVDVLDGEGMLLMTGRLDADGELQVAWPYDVLPWVRIAQAGGAFRVELAP